MRCIDKQNSKGFTLLEVLVTMSLFLGLIALMYPLFDVVKSQTATISDANRLSDKGQRILAYMEEDFRMAGFLLGADARIPYCSAGVVPADPNVITYTAGNPYDTLTFLTSIPVSVKENVNCMTAQKDCAGLNRADYLLTTKCDSAEGAGTVTVDASVGSASSDCVVNDISAADANNNGKSLITFESLRLSAASVAGSAPRVYYTVSNVDSSSSLAVSPNLAQTIPDNSTVYSVRQYRYEINTTGGARNLERVAWKKDCSEDPAKLIEINSLNSSTGGVDGLKYEFVYEDTIFNKLVTSSTLPPLSQLRAINIWLLLRSDLPDRNYKDTKTYTLGTTAGKITLGPYNDKYRRLLLFKTVEVKNLASF